jgi:hypothetical protein
MTRVVHALLLGIMVASTACSQPAPVVELRPTSAPAPPPAPPTQTVVPATPQVEPPRFEELQPAGSGDPRFGVIVVGGTDSDVDGRLTGLLDELGAATWYSYQPSIGQARGQVGLVRPGADLAHLAQLARAAPGSAWLIGNEPNVPGQDDLPPERYATFLWEVAETIKAADETALLVGPNVLNWDVTCRLCPGFTSGRAWSETMEQIYTALYGPLPFDVWGMHTYSLNWAQLPLTDADADQQQIIGARSWLNGRGLRLPIWLTEFGVIWGYDGIEWVPAPSGALVAEPRGTFRADRIQVYLDRMLGWLKETGPRLGVERWFLYGTSPDPEPYAATIASLSLVDPDNGTLTTFGERYRGWAYGRLAGRAS